MSTSTRLSPERERMVTGLFATIDRRDTDGLLELLTSDASQRFGNRDPLKGSEEIRQGNDAFFASIRGLHHSIVDAWETDGTVAIRLDVTYTRLDDGVITIPAMTVIHVEESGLIDEYEVFADMGPLFAPAV